MAVIGVLSFLICIIFCLILVIGLIKPSIFKIKGQPLDRKSIALYSLIGIVVSFIVTGVAALTDGNSEAKQDKSVATQVKTQQEPKTENTTQEEIKVPESTLNMTPEEFRAELNKQIEEKDLSELELFKHFNMKKVGNGEMFQYELADGKIVMTGTTAANGQLKEVFFVMGGLESADDMMNGMGLPLLVAQVLNKSVSLDANNKAVLDLIGKAADGIKKENNDYSLDVGELTYYSLASPQIGFWIGFKPKES